MRTTCAAVAACIVGCSWPAARAPRWARTRTPRRRPDSHGAGAQEPARTPAPTPSPHRTRARPSRRPYPSQPVVGLAAGSDARRQGVRGAAAAEDLTSFDARPDENPIEPLTYDRLNRGHHRRPSRSLGDAAPLRARRRPQEFRLPDLSDDGTDPPTGHRTGPPRRRTASGGDAAVAVRRHDPDPGARRALTRTGVRPMPCCLVPLAPRDPETSTTDVVGDGLPSTDDVVRAAYSARADEYTAKLGSMSAMDPVDRRLISEWAMRLRWPHRRRRLRSRALDPPADRARGRGRRRRSRPGVHRAGPGTLPDGVLSRRSARRPRPA